MTSWMPPTLRTPITAVLRTYGCRSSSPELIGEVLGHAIEAKKKHSLSVTHPSILPQKNNRVICIHYKISSVITHCDEGEARHGSEPRQGGRALTLTTYSRKLATRKEHSERSARPRTVGSWKRGRDTSHQPLAGLQVDAPAGGDLCASICVSRAYSRHRLPGRRNPCGAG